MTHDYKPEGYNSVAVYIMAQGAKKVIEFLEATFDATTTRRYENEDGSIRHVEVKIDDSIIMLAEAQPDYPGFAAWLHVYVPDVDVTYRRALEAGGESVQEPIKSDDPDKRGGVKDPAGNVWWIATQVG